MMYMIGNFSLLNITPFLMPFGIYIIHIATLATYLIVFIALLVAVTRSFTSDPATYVDLHGIIYTIRHNRHNMGSR